MSTERATLIHVPAQVSAQVSAHVPALPQSAASAPIADPAADPCGCGHEHHHHDGHHHHHHHGHAPGVTLTRQGPKIGRNDACPCGSGKKYKKCCLATG